jgi:hypothetical protein
MKYIKKVNELRTGIILHDPILEMAQVNDPKDIPYDIYIYGGDSYGSGRNEHGYPHFHFADKIKGGDWQFSVFIPTVGEWKQNKELYIYEASNGDYTWNGFRKQKKMLIGWLDKPNKFDSGKSNLEFIRMQWNFLNTNNKNVSQIKRIK